MFKIIRKRFITIDQIKNIHPYLKECLTNKQIQNFTDIQYQIFTDINDKNISVLLCDEYSGRKFSTISGIMNRILHNKNDYTQTEEFFLSPEEVFKSSKLNKDINLAKKNQSPRGALFISYKFDFLTHYYRILRRLDFDNRIRVVRLGNSLQSVTPTVEVEHESDSESSKEDVQDLIKINLINSSEWRKIDILFTSPNMLNLVMNMKNKHDEYDINPEMIILDDFDYMVKDDKIKPYFENILNKFFIEWNPSRKLILCSSSIQVKGVFEDNFELNFENLWELNFFNTFGNKSYIKSSNFLNKNFHLSNVNITKHNSENGLFEKKFKILFKLLNKSIIDKKNLTIVCCNESNINLIKSHLNSKKIKHLIISNSL